MMRRCVTIVGAVTAAYFSLNLLFVSRLREPDAREQAEWEATLHQARSRERSTLVAAGPVPRYGTAPPQLPSQGAGAAPPRQPSPPVPGPPATGGRRVPPAHVRAQRPPPPPRAPRAAAGTPGSRPLLLYRTRFREPSGFSQEAIDFVRGLSAHYYVGIQMEGNNIEGYVKSWSPQLRAMIDRYHARECGPDPTPSLSLAAASLTGTE